MSASKLVRALNYFSGSQIEGSTGGSARFATSAEMAECRDSPTDGALVFGEVWRKDAPLSWNRTVSVKDDRPVLTLAPTRSGKGRSQIIRNVLSYPGSIVSIDPKGEAALVTAAKKAKQGHRVHLLDPFSVCAKLRGKALGYESSFNPLAMIDRDDPSAGDDIRSLVECMVLDDSEYWGPQTKIFVAGMFARFLLWPKPQPIGMIFDLLAMPGEEFVNYLGQLSHGITGNHPLGLLFLSAKEAYMGKEKKSRDILKQCTLNALAIFSSPPMQAVMEPGGWTFQDVQRKPTAVYLVLPPDKLVSHAAWLRLMVFCGMAGMARGPKPKHQTLVVLDEFANLGRMEQIKSAVSYASGLGMKLWIVVQDVGQIREHYGDCYSTFFANAGAIAVLGAGDNDSRKEVSDLLGSTKMISRQKEIGQGRDSRLTETTVPLLTPDEVGRYCTRETGGMLLLLQGRYPMRLQRRNYDEVLRPGIDFTVHPDFIQRSELNDATSGDYRDERRPAGSANRNNRRGAVHSANHGDDANRTRRPGRGRDVRQRA